MCDPKIVVGTGWYSSAESTPWHTGDDLIRTPMFFALWHRQVTRYLRPGLIFVTDSNAPRKPDWTRFSDVRVMELDRNYGHANDIRVGNISTKFSGFTRSVLMGATFAVCCDADYYIYVEQDCLIRGEDFLQAAIAEQDYHFYCGAPPQGGLAWHGGEPAKMPQRSLQIVPKRGLETFISKLVTAPESDGELSGEVKMGRDMAPHGYIAFPYGRSRPIDFTRPHFYAQHMTLDEIRQFMSAENLRFEDWFEA